MTFSSNDKLSNDLGKILKQQRVMLEMTLREFSLMLGVSASHLGRIERGQRLPSARILQKIAKPLGFQEDELLTLAGYLSPKASAEVESEAHNGILDPYVAMVLSQEPVEIQRTILAILSIFKNMTKGSQGRIEFREYARRQYPELDEDVVTMIEDIIKRPQG